MSKINIIVYGTTLINNNAFNVETLQFEWKRVAEWGSNTSVVMVADSLAANTANPRLATANHEHCYYAMRPGSMIYHYH